LPDRPFAALKAGFARATRAHPAGLTESSFLLAGRPVRVRVAGHGLAERIARPLAHLAAPTPPGPGLRIDLWDAEETGMPSPLRPTSEEAVTSSSDGRFMAYRRPGCALALDRANQHLVGFQQSCARLRLDERARPLTLPLTVWCSDRGVSLVHAGLVAQNGHGVLLGGSSEAGKSTTALACAGAGFDFLGDDCVALSVSAQGELEGHSLYGSTTVETGHLAAFGPLPAAAADDEAPEGEKSLIFLDRVARTAPIRVLALPRVVSSRNSGFRPATKGEALLELAPSSLIRRAVDPRASLRRMARLVDRVPVYWLELDPELASIPRRVERMLAEAGLR
jgi:hypothetical protein